MNNSRWHTLRRIIRRKARPNRPRYIRRARTYDDALDEIRGEIDLLWDVINTRISPLDYEEHLGWLEDLEAEEKAVMEAQSKLESLRFYEWRGH